MAHDNPSIQSSAFEIPPSVPIHPLEAEAWKSHFVLPQSLQTQFRIIRDDVQKALAQQQLEIAHVRATLNRLLDEENLLISRLLQLRSAVTPIKKLPLELLSEIFAHCVDSPLSLPPRKPDMVVNFALTAVCSLWRQVAINTRALWDDVSVSYSFSLPEDSLEQFLLSRGKVHPHVLDVLESERAVHLQKTESARKIIARGTRSLEIEIRGVTSVDTVVACLPPELDPALHLILPFAPQLRHITLICPTPQVLYNLLRSQPPMFHALESITLRHSDTDHTGSRLPDQVVVFSNTPALKRFTLQTSSATFLRYLTRPASGLPRAQLTHISLADTWLTVDAAHSIVLQSPYMTHLDIGLSWYQPLGIRTIESITHHFLQFLTIVSPESEAIGAFLQPLHLQALHFLELNARVKIVVGQFSSEAVAGCIKFITRSGCSLRTFRGCFRISERNLEVLFSLLSPTLEKLSIPDVPLDAFLPRIAQRALLPNLEHVDCSIAHSANSVQYFMHVMLRGGGGKRSSPGLRAATAYYDEKVEPDPLLLDAQKRFKELSEQLVRRENRFMTMIPRRVRGLI